MERLHLTKRRRVYSIEPGRRMQVQRLFAIEYVNYLVPALMQIRKLEHSSENDNDVLKNKVKYEADMALALSARGLAWSNALRNELQRDINEPQKSNSDIVEQQATGSLLWSSDQTGQFMAPREFKPNPSIWPLIKENKKDSEEEEHTNVKLKSVKLLMPGGDQMGDDEEMLAELVSYISCLKMQVDVLESLVQIIH